MDIPIAPRFQVTLQVQIASDEAARPLLGVTQNISESGALLLSERIEPAGGHFCLTFPTFKGTAELVWTSEPEESGPFLAGMQFVSLAPADRGALERLLEYAGSIQRS